MIGNGAPTGGNGPLNVSASPDLLSARAAFDNAQAETREREAEVAARAAELARLARTASLNDPELRRATAEHAAAVSRLREARATEDAARINLGEVLGSSLPRDPTADLESLDARYPIALFPVRVETRFDRDGSSLLVRVYPDEILADAHEPELTQGEQQNGARFWADARGAAGEQEAWRHLVGTYPPQRAAWIARATDPAAAQAPLLRPTTWTRAVEARLLPDRWIAVAYRGGAEVARGVSRIVAEPLPLSVRPNAPATETIDVSGSGLQIDRAVAWSMDFARAEEAGMGFRVLLEPPDLANGIDRLLVFGVKATVSPDHAATRLGALLDAHHYTRGFAFVAQGTPTNDSKDLPSGYPPEDPNGTRSFRVERGASLATNEGDGQRWARVFGLPSDVVAHIEGADRMEQRSAEAMNRALFPATWGYFLETMMAPVVSTDGIDRARSYFVNYVRARGPLPVFRIGGVPYGALPVSSLTQWEADPGSVEEETIVPLLRTARDFWTSLVASVPRVGRSADTDADLLDTLAMDASSRAIRLRQLLGEDAQSNLNTLLGFGWTGWQAVQEAVAQIVLARIGHPEWTPRVLRSTFAETTHRCRFAFVSDPPLSESQPLSSNYIQWIRTAAITDLQGERVPFPAVPTALLYRLLRYAALTEYWREAKRILIVSRSATPAALAEHELIRIVPGTEDRLTPWEYLARSVPSVTGSLSLAQYLSPVAAGQPLRTLPEPVVAYQDALATLEALPTAELHRLTTETLDLASHRLDAWITSLASKRLGELRNKVPSGIHLGAFAWVEDIRPDQAMTQPVSDGRSARSSVGGYIHAPSMTHAATAAVLRNGYLTHATGAGNTPYAVDLSSARVRRARFVLESVQTGQAVGAVLGYQIERGLHERQVEMLIDPLRSLFPLVANKSFDSGEIAEAIAGRNVVDGLQLRAAWREGKLTFGSGGLPAGGSRRDALEAELRALDETVDAVADLLLAESVHQIVRGSAMASSAGLDALAQGVRPPDPAFAHGLRGGTDVTHRVALLLGGAPLELGPGWPAQPTPRAGAEPRLDAWVGSLLGDPRGVKCRVRVPDPTPQQPNHMTEREVSLARLGVRPLDVLALATNVTDTAEASELDRRAIFAALGDAPALGPVEVVYARANSWDRAAVRTFPEVLELAQAISRVLGGARPLRAEDLVRAEDASDASSAVWSGDEAMARAAATESMLRTARVPLAAAVAAVPIGAKPTDAQRTALQNALRDVAGFGLPAAFPLPGHGAEEGGVPIDLLTQATSVLAEIDARLARAVSAHPAIGANAGTRATAAVEIAHQILGRDFLLVPGFVPPRSAELAQALGAGSALVGDPHAPRRWLQQAARVRAPVARWRMMRLLADALDAPAAILAVAQLPHEPGARWAALPLANEADRKPGRLSLALIRAVSPAATETWFGLHLDEWVEVIPNPTELTGLSFHYDDPGAEAAQTVLVAVPPVEAQQRWDFETLAAILNETLDLVKIRGVDGRLLGELGQLLPAIYFASNTNDDTIVAKFDGAMMADRVLQAAL
jgi:hypothetical protein